MTSSCLTKIVVAKDIVCTLISSNNLHNNKAIARVLGVDRRNIKRGWDIAWSIAYDSFAM
jgi:hypothetical protein